MSDYSVQLRQQVARVRTIVDSLWEHRSAVEDAIVADGWPRAMAREGLALHRTTWQVDALIDALEQELHGIGGLHACGQFVSLPAQQRVCYFAPEHVVHIWPALPGAGVTGVLLGEILGATQSIRASGRGENFARYFSKLSGIELLDDSDDWSDADIVVASGSDETILYLQKTMMNKGKSPGQLIGYGHRISFAVVVDDPENQELVLLEEWANALSRDIVLWHQKGCFSVRGVIFCGSSDRADIFANLLGDAIEMQERRLEATTIAPEALAIRAQALGVAQFRGHKLYGNGIGRVRMSDESLTADMKEPIHWVSLHHIDNMEALESVIAMKPHHIQGVALAVGESHAEKEEWMHRIAQLGATHISKPGMMQSPSPYWFHDGQLNITNWLRICVA